MAKIKVVGLGLAALDVLVRFGELPTWEHGTRMSDFRLDGGGPVATAMVAASRLGVPAGFIGIAGTDKMGDMKADSLTENGVDISRLVRRPGPEPSMVLVHVQEETGERVFSCLRDTRDLALRIAELDRKYITSADYLHLDGHHVAATLQAAQWMQAAGKTVVLDGSKTNRKVSGPMRQLIKYVDILICASGFGPGLTGRTEVWDVGRAILEMGPRIVVQTEGEKGSYTLTRNEQFHTPAFEIDVLDTTGAGDVFHGAFIVGLLQDWPLRKIAQFATAVSALKCTQLGGRSGIPTFEAALAFLRQRGIDIYP